MNFRSLSTLGRVALATAFCAVPFVQAANDSFSAELSGANEVPPINSAGTATFQMTLGTPINFTMKFSGLSSNLTLSHIHFGQPGVAGGVMIFLCGGGGQPACPVATSGTITGTITAANVTGPTAQGIAAADLNSALEVIKDGEGYVNMHTTIFGGGEIRGQLRRGHGKDKDDD
ncbi:MAG: CHRD domain-containing protein [Acidobacteriia bacterium]|nr:CHRD domain-containing protein [Terriglobia bacterium]